MKCTRAGSSGPGFFTDFAGAKITSDAGFLLMREIDQRFGIIENGCHRLVDERSAPHKKHTFEQMIRQRVYQIAANKEVKVYNGRGDVENRIKEGKNTLRWDKTSCHRFRANEARLKMGFLAYNLLQLIRWFYLLGEDTRRSIEWIITRLVKAGAWIAALKGMP